MEIIKKYFSEFSPLQENQLCGLEACYREWNQRINVISRKDIDNFYLHHVLHSLSIAAQFDFLPGEEVLDLGTGGGFPGIPLAIFFPDTQFHLVDSINKKLTVVKEVAQALEIKNIITQHSRVEDIKGRTYHTVISRAVAPLKDLWQWSRPLIGKKPQGTERPNGLICLKGGDLTLEIAESGCKPFVWDIHSFFPEEYFHEKYLLYQPLK